MTLLILWIYLLINYHLFKQSKKDLLKPINESLDDFISKNGESVEALIIYYREYFQLQSNQRNQTCNHYITLLSVLIVACVKEFNTADKIPLCVLSVAVFLFSVLFMFFFVRTTILRNIARESLIILEEKLNICLLSVTEKAKRKKLGFILSSVAEKVKGKKLGFILSSVAEKVKRTILNFSLLSVLKKIIKKKENYYLPTYSSLFLFIFVVFEIISIFPIVIYWDDFSTWIISGISGTFQCL